MSKSPRPRSAAHFGVNSFAMLAGLSTMAALAHWQLGFFDSVEIVLLSGAVVGVSITAGEWWWRRRSPAPRDTGLDAPAAQRIEPARVATRLLGLLATVAAIGFLYWLFPEYHGSFYAPYWRFLRLLAPIVAPAAIAYFAWTDARLSEPRDTYWRIGRCLMGRFADRPAFVHLRAHALGWLVKAFFLPLMVVYARDQVNDLAHVLGGIASTGLTANLYPLMFRLGYSVDLLFCVVGYVLTLRVLDSQIRSTDTTVAGWLVALVCYQPFYSVIGTYYLAYSESDDWARHFSTLPNVGDAWGFTILALVLIYGLSTVAFGMRFSNLTNRGIITGGPYRYMKHPAYVSKNLSWWLVSMPFLSAAGPGTALRHCLLLGLLNGVYYLRAKTEERHLGADPAYVAYAAWIAEHGLIARARRSLWRLAPKRAKYGPQ
jgi:protein-S-isoprenylcysteine O-methyltransferase Ste14